MGCHRLCRVGSAECAGMKLHEHQDAPSMQERGGGSLLNRNCSMRPHARACGRAWVGGTGRIRLYPLTGAVDLIKTPTASVSPITVSAGTIYALRQRACGLLPRALATVKPEHVPMRALWRQRGGALNSCAPRCCNSQSKPQPRRQAQADLSPTVHLHRVLSRSNKSTRGQACRPPPKSIWYPR